MKLKVITITITNNLYAKGPEPSATSKNPSTWMYADDHRGVASCKIRGVDDGYRRHRLFVEHKTTIRLCHAALTMSVHHSCLNIYALNPDGFLMLSAGIGNGGHTHLFADGFCM
jgi:hypothetical protein